MLLLAAGPPAGRTILQKLDENAASESRIVVSQMVIHSRRGTRTLRAKSWVQGSERAFTEFLAPPRDAGTKMLKLGDELWTYAPAADRVIRISGHMLRQSVMGSDLSYEDLMEETRLAELYEAEVIGEDTLLGRQCWIVQLAARQADVAYVRRRLWVDQEHYLALREERYARSGELLKTAVVKAVQRMKNRWVATQVVFRDVLRQGEGTEFILESIEFNANIPEQIFSKAALR